MRDSRLVDEAYRVVPEMARMAHASTTVTAPLAVEQLERFRQLHPTPQDCERAREGFFGTEVAPRRGMLRARRDVGGGGGGEQRAAKQDSCHQLAVGLIRLLRGGHKPGNKAAAREQLHRVDEEAGVELCEPNSDGYCMHVETPAGQCGTSSPRLNPPPDTDGD